MNWAGKQLAERYVRYLDGFWWSVGVIGWDATVALCSRPGNDVPCKFVVYPKTPAPRGVG